MTARQAYAAARERLQAAGLPEVDPIARILLEEALALPLAQMVAAWENELSEGQLQRIEGWLTALLNGEPLQYVLGHWSFYGRVFRTDRRALIPRDDTETLVEAALQRGPQGAARVIDVGCGTGCIGITLKKERPQWDVTLLDISADALALAAENATALDAPVRLLQADLFAPLPDGSYDMIVSNPPYVSAEEYAALDPLVRDNEPALALLGGTDGLAHLQALAQRAKESLKSGGRLLAEVGYRQSAAVQVLFTEVLGSAEAIRDIGGVERVIASGKG